jgi:uncharacterized protein with beta-barrel porin domain
MHRINNAAASRCGIARQIHEARLTAGRDSSGNPAPLRSGLLATSALCSVAGAALLWTTGLEPVHANPVCAIAVTGASGAVTNAGTVNCISISTANVTGNVTNSGKLTSNTAGIVIVGSTIAGGVQDTGLIAGGIILDAASKLNQFGTAILLSGSTFSGGISNAGAISGAQDGIWEKTSTFAGGITNSGTISATGEAIQIEGGSFSGGISNSGTITSSLRSAINVISVTTFAGGINNAGLLGSSRWGIEIGNVSAFSGGIANGGTITASGAGYPAIVVANVSTFSGDISNIGTIIAANHGIELFNISIFSGNISNAGTIAAAGSGLQINGVSTFLGGITNSGTISGNVGIGTGPGTGPVSIFNSGVITGTGGSAINFGGSPGNTLTLGSGYQINGKVVGSGSDTFQLGGSGNGGFDLSSIGAGQQYQGFTTFNVVGGTWTVVNSFAQTQAWNVNGGTLAGTGILNAVNVNNGGTLAPGTPGSPGTAMTINGNLAFQSGAIYLVQLNSSTASLVNVSGTATLAGAVKVSGIPSPMTYDILHSGGLNNTQFQPFSEAGYIGTLSYSATDVFLNVTGANLGAGDSDQNQQRVASSINNFFNSGGTLPAGFLPIFGLTGGDQDTALSQLSGEAATGAQQVSTQVMNQFFDLLFGSSGAQAGSGTGHASGFAAEKPGGYPPEIALAYDSVMAAQPANFAQRLSVWGAGFGGNGTFNGDATIGSHDLAASTYGYAAGVDDRLTPDLLVGFAVAGGGSNWALTQNLGSGRSNVFQGGVRAILHAGPAYIEAAAAFANHWFTTGRTAFAGDQLTARFQGQSYGGRFEAGYRFAAWPAIGVAPYSALQTQLFHTPSYSETDLTGGGFGLSYASSNVTDTRSEFGARFDSLQILDTMPLVWRARLAWAHDWVSSPALTATFETLPGANFVVSGAAMPANSVLTTAGARLYLTPNWSVEAKFDGDFARTAQTYAGTGTIRYSW